MVLLKFSQDEKGDQESLTPQSKKKTKKKNRLKNSIKAKMAVKRMFGDTNGPSATERSASPTLSYDSGSGDEEGQRLGIGVKTHSQRVAPGVSVNYPIQFQVSRCLAFLKNVKSRNVLC